MPENKDVHHLLGHLYCIDTAVEGNDVHCYNTEGNRNSVVSQASCKMDVTPIEQYAYIKIALKLPHAQCGIL